MRKLEAVTKEIVDEMGYLQRREMRMSDTNGESLFVVLIHSPEVHLDGPPSPVHPYMVTLGTQ